MLELQIIFNLRAITHYPLLIFRLNHACLPTKAGIKWIAQITRILKKRMLELQIIFNLRAITHYPLPIFRLNHACLPTKAGIKWIAQITRILKKRMLELQIIFNLRAITHYPLSITHDHISAKISHLLLRHHPITRSPDHSIQVRSAPI